MIDRRALIGCAGAALGPRALAQPSPSVRFLPLKTPVTIPLATLGEKWASTAFKARFTKSDGADSVVPGIAMKTPAGVKAFCAYCPHELCVIKLNDEHKLRCPCHFSLFDPERDGAYIAGPALRRTFEFRYSVAGADLTVTGVEADLERRLL